MPYESLYDREHMIFRAWFCASGLAAIIGVVLLMDAHTHSFRGIVRGLGGISLLVIAMIVLRHGWRKVGDYSD